ncbi:PulJ/GspJ family protein [Lysinibacillus sp. NPDC093712]|uniref:PulJ/GspJ family protein n=1 Tax=Lysinibacillus sp. NPDC093712 TaxID=3390579 RepID=UPI003D023E1E
MSKLQNEKGMTLLEVLAATIIVTIISVFLLSILINSNNTSNKQMKSSMQLTDASYALKVITKDARKSTQLKSSGDEYTLKNDQNSEEYIYKFNREDQILTRNKEVIASNVSNFKIDNMGNYITIEITQPGNKPFLSTIYFRGGI